RFDAAAQPVGPAPPCGRAGLGRTAAVRPGPRGRSGLCPRAASPAGNALRMLRCPGRAPGCDRSVRALANSLALAGRCVAFRGSLDAKRLRPRGRCGDGGAGTKAATLPAHDSESLMMRIHRDWLLTPERAAVHLPTATAIVADLHLGYNHARRRTGEA